MIMILRAPRGNTLPEARVCRDVLQRQLPGASFSRVFRRSRRMFSCPLKLPAESRRSAQIRPLWQGARSIDPAFVCGPGPSAAPRITNM
ncbi:hypothetical protein NDU88_001385 [Pleurodeles waltl]|uniref:Uncharacterized protein n=1 Tax=Pleurodeles waltl TaxID=8319 RepID=A0AAV7KRC5_PLEWA|nr:hypothetical protein NDU88_001385 [Pleurodeles waltl]